MSFEETFCSSKIRPLYQGRNDAGKIKRRLTMGIMVTLSKVGINNIHTLNSSVRSLTKKSTKIDYMQDLVEYHR